MNENQRFNLQVPAQQRTQQGSNAGGNCLSRNVRQTRQIQPGNEFVYKIRPAIPGPVGT